MKNIRTTTFSVLAFAATTATAQSDVQLYGLVDSMAYRKQLAGEAYATRIDSGGLNTSFWGMRGREDLGGGLSAQFDLSAFFRTSSGYGRNDNDPLFSRGSWVGLQGDWGSLRMGRQSTLAFLNLVRYSALGASSTFNPAFVHNYQSSATQPMMTGSGAADSVWSGAVSYATPSNENVGGAIYYAPSESATTGKRVGANMTVTYGGFSAGLVGEKISSMALNFAKPPTNLAMNNSSLWSLGASYDFKVVKLYAQMIKTELSNAKTNLDFSTRSVGATIPAGPGSLLLGYAQTTKTQSALADTKRRTATLAYEYRLSKRTDLYGVLMEDRVTGLSGGLGYAVGIRHRF